MELQKLVNELLFTTIDNKQNPDITAINMDSRIKAPGSLFVCIDGLTLDGHDFVHEAVQNGAVAVLAEKDVKTTVPVVRVSDTKRAMAILADRFYGQPTKQLHLIGITGTNGKTTTSHIIEKIFRDCGNRTGLIGTIDMKINGESYKVSNTTPDCIFLQKAFKQMVDEKVNTAVMEVSSHALDQGRVRGCDFNIAVFTNLTQDHLDYHETMDEYLHAKGLLFSQLGNTYSKENKKIAVLNNDDPASKRLKRMTSAQVITYGIDQPADIMAKNINITAKGTSFTLVTPKEKKEVSIKLIGKFSVYNVLASISAALGSGISLDAIIHSIEQVEGVPGRFETVNAGQDFTVIVDYSHTPDSLENALMAIKEFATGKVYVVVGCGGDRDKTKRPIMAQIAVEHADTAIFTSDNPRTEDPEAILQDMERGVEGEEYVKIVNRKDAIEYAINQAKKDDIVLIAGKGHETYQIIGKNVFDFDDRQVAKEAIGAKN
ncbi:UDP-N-acetylmuramoyl-L-alanyl-D-glutamate--2,6-diaminopimelate ligase [Fictibacillus sp. Mic-4]|uniref:UDP-N-acetylmuramoyl-L-alanyl-D-glutamate--2, 6-diaminopimelate ligase n=1 Tax=Fictibacillus sp. Mic-4 TaxID=3132826 RepID=UPI003CF2B45D